MFSARDRRLGRCRVFGRAAPMIERRRKRQGRTKRSVNRAQSDTSGLDVPASRFDGCEEKLAAEEIRISGALPKISSETEIRQIMPFGEPVSASLEPGRCETGIEQKRIGPETATLRRADFGGFQAADRPRIQSRIFCRMLVS